MKQSKRSNRPTHTLAAALGSTDSPSSSSSSPSGSTFRICSVKRDGQEKNTNAKFNTMKTISNMLQRRHAHTSTNKADTPAERTSTQLATRYGSCLLTLSFSAFSLIFSVVDFCSCCSRTSSVFITRTLVSNTLVRFSICSAEWGTIAGWQGDNHMRCMQTCEKTRARAAAPIAKRIANWFGTVGIPEREVVRIEAAK